jgi:hypothetical protein
MRTLILICGVMLAASCADEVKGKKLGESCLLHEECASKLCTVAPREAGASDGGVGKVCTSPTI